METSFLPRPCVIPLGLEQRGPTPFATFRPNLPLLRVPLRILGKYSYLLVRILPEAMEASRSALQICLFFRLPSLNGNSPCEIYAGSPPILKLSAFEPPLPFGFFVYAFTGTKFFSGLVRCGSFSSFSNVFAPYLKQPVNRQDPLYGNGLGTFPRLWKMVPMC